MRTTLTIDDELGARLEDLARRGGRSFKEVVNETLRRGLDTKAPPSKPFKIEARSLALRPGVQLDNVAELLEQIDGSTHK